MPNNVGNNKQAGDNVNDDPKSFQEQCYPCFAYGQDRNIRTIFVCLPHQVPGCSSPYAFKTVHLTLTYNRNIAFVCGRIACVFKHFYRSDAYCWIQRITMVPVLQQPIHLVIAQFSKHFAAYSRNNT